MENYAALGEAIAEHGWDVRIFQRSMALDGPPEALIEKRKRSRKTRRSFSDLTYDAQLEVVDLYYRGRTLSEIADKLKIRIRAVELCIETHSSTDRRRMSSRRGSVNKDEARSCFERGMTIYQVAHTLGVSKSYAGTLKRKFESFND